MMVYCVSSLESPHGGDSNEKTKYIIFNIKKNHPKLSQICSYGIFSKGLKNEFETAVVNKPSVFEPLKFYCSLRSVCELLQVGRKKVFGLLEVGTKSL